MKKLIPFVVIWLTDSVLLYLANLLYPLNYVLGNARVGVVIAAILAGFVWTLLAWVAKPLVSKFNIKFEGFWMKCGFYLITNFVALWITARMAPVVGFGVSSFMYVLGLVVVAEIIQVLVWRLIAPLAKKI